MKPQLQLSQLFQASGVSEVASGLMDQEAGIDWPKYCGEGSRSSILVLYGI